MTNKKKIPKTYNIDILYIVDLKHRDLPIAKRIGHHLTLNGQIVALSNGAIAFEQIRNINPKLIIIPKANWNPTIVAKCILKSIKVSVVETEGNPQDNFFKAKVILQPDLHLFWNREQQNLYSYSPITKKCVLGNPRTDLIIDSYNDSIKNHIDKPLEKFITIATASQDTHYSTNMLKNKARKRKNTVSTTTDYSDAVEDMRYQRNVVTEFLKQYSRSNIPHKICLKPHPHEAVTYWQTLIKEINDGRIHLMLGKPIEDLLTISKFHISYAACSTSAEALLMKLPVLQLRAPNSLKNYHQAHLEACHYNSYDTSQIFETIDILFDHANKQTDEAIATNTIFVQNYVSHYFHIADGFRAKAYADTIHSFITSKILVNKLYFLPRQFKAICLSILSDLKKRMLKTSTTNTNKSEDFQKYATSLYDHHIESLLICE